MDFSANPRASNTRRILALYLPLLSTDRLKRKDASLSEKPPLVISGKANNALYVQALEARAQKLGLYKGQPLANARAMVRDLTIIPADDKKDLELLEGIADWCDRFSPFVAADPPDGLIIDITGASHLFGGEAAMLDHVVRKITVQGFAVQGAIAGTRSAARALAKFAASHIAAPGRDAESLERLPVAALTVDAKVIAALMRAGLKTIAQVRGRARDELASRFGKAFVTELEMFLAQHDQPVNPRRPLPDLMAEQRFAEPVVTQEAIAASLLSLAQSLGEVLEKRGLGLRQLEASFFRADGQLRRILLRLGSASRDPGRVLRLLREKLDALHDPLDPGFGFDLIRLEALLAERNETVSLSFDSGENARREIQYLADRLSVRYGESRVLRFVAQDTHIPEAQSAGVPAQERDFAGASWPSHRLEGDPPLRPLRLFEKPEEIDVPVAPAPDGPPASFRWRRAKFDIAHAEGPERIAMEWWRSAGPEKREASPTRSYAVATNLGDFRRPRDQNKSAGESRSGQNKAENPTRDYFRVETKQGQRFWLYRDGLYDQSGFHPRWYLHGVFA
jgi:protein ImuB